MSGAIRFPITDSISISVKMTNKGLWTHAETYYEVELYDIERKFVTKQYFPDQHSEILVVKPNEIIRIIGKVQIVEQEHKAAIIRAMESVKNKSNKLKKENIRTKEDNERRESKKSFRLIQKLKRFRGKK